MKEYLTKHLERIAAGALFWMIFFPFMAVLLFGYESFPEWLYAWLEAASVILFLCITYFIGFLIMDDQK